MTKGLKKCFLQKRLLLTVLLTALFALSFTCNVFATEATTEQSQAELYEAKIEAPAPVDGPDDQAKLLAQAFKDLLVKLTGSEKILEHATITKAIAEVDNYVSQFGFQVNEKKERLFRARFNAVLCQELLKNAGQPILSANRPPVVLWLAMQKNNVKQWVGGEMQQELSQQLETLAMKRGLTLVYPLLDITDTNLVSELQVWNEDLPALQAASKRYNADQLLIGKLSKQPTGWYAQWTYVKQGNSIRWDMSNTELATVFGEALDEFSKRLGSDEAMLAKAGSAAGQGFDAVSSEEQAKQEARLNAGMSAKSASSNANKILRLSVSGVSGGAEYAKVIRYLKDLPTVKNVEVAEISHDQTIFNIDTDVSHEVFANSIVSGDLLIENTLNVATDVAVDVNAGREEAKTTNETPMLNYRLVSMKDAGTNP